MVAAADHSTTSSTCRADLIDHLHNAGSDRVWALADSDARQFSLVRCQSPRGRDSLAAPYLDVQHDRSAVHLVFLWAPSVCKERNTICLAHPAAPLAHLVG